MTATIYRATNDREAWIAMLTFVSCPDHYSISCAGCGADNAREPGVWAPPVRGAIAYALCNVCRLRANQSDVDHDFWTGVERRISDPAAVVLVKDWDDSEGDL